jgi:hypothetical protein
MVFLILIELLIMAFVSTLIRIKSIRFILQQYFFNYLLMLLPFNRFIINFIIIILNLGFRIFLNYYFNLFIYLVKTNHFINLIIFDLIFFLNLKFNNLQN